MQGQVHHYGFLVFAPTDYPVHYFTYGWECIYTHGPPDLFLVCSGVYGASGV
jgi:hypothetical protein